MEISIIVAISENYAMGLDNQMPWHLPADLQHFKRLTTGHTIIMGRKTYQSLPNGALPNRRNIVLSRAEKVETNQYEQASSLKEAFELCQNDEKVFIIGGGSIYKQAIDLPVVTTMHITWIHHKFDADVFFPKIDFTKWEEVEKETHKANEKNRYDYTFTTYKRKK